VAYEYLIYGKRPQVNAYRKRYRWLYFRMDRRAFRELSGQRELTLAAWIASLVAKPAVYEIFAWSDPLPFMLEVGRRVAARLGRYTCALLLRRPARARPNS
jgi:hypothetical protein